MAANRESHITDPNATLGGKFQIAGKTVANIPQVEANTRTLRGTLRPTDTLTFGGAYMVSGDTGVSSNLQTATWLSFVWNHFARVAVIKKVLISCVNVAAGNSAGQWTFRMLRSSAYTVPPGTGTKTILAPTSIGILRNKFLEPQATVWIAASGSTLTGMTQTVDTNPVGIVRSAIIASIGAGNVIPPQTPIFDARPGEQTLVLHGNQGFDLTMINPAADSNPRMAATIYWEEYAMVAY